MPDLSDTKAALRHYLQEARDALLWKLDGLGERDLRLPRTPTGTNLLGIVRHVANVEIGYFGPTFGREWTEPDHPLVVTDADYDSDPQSDWWVPADIPASAVVELYRAVAAFSDETIAGLSLDAPGAVPWWPEDRREVSLGRILVHVVADTTRHAGHADILREGIDGAAGLLAAATNLPEVDWPAYVTRLTQVAEQFEA
ncbi:DinB family protein [Alloalcanivorax gelatiniphagus]